MHLGNEMTQHRFGHFKVRDHAIFQRPHRDNVRRRAPEHSLRLVADREHFVGAGLHGHHRRFAQDDALVFYVDQRVGGTEIDADVVGEQTEKSVEHEICCSSTLETQIFSSKRCASERDSNRLKRRNMKQRLASSSS